MSLARFLLLAVFSRERINVFVLNHSSSKNDTHNEFSKENIITS